MSLPYEVAHSAGLLFAVLLLAVPSAGFLASWAVVRLFEWRDRRTARRSRRLAGRHRS